MKNEKRKFTIIIVILVIIIIGVIGLAFAYFNARTSSLGQTITVGELDIIYVDGNTLRADNLTPISEKDSETLGTELSFSVKNRGKLDGYFDIQIKDIIGDNELKNKDLKWNLIENNVVIRSGNFLNVESSLNILNSEEIKVGETKNYKIVVFIEETNEDQSIMQSKGLEGIITINSSTETKSFRDTTMATLNNTKEGSKIKNLRIYGNSVQNEEATLTNPKEIQSVGDLTKNLFDYTKVTGANIETIENGLKLTEYACVTNITPEMFLEMTGLKEGDTVTTTLNKKLTHGIPNDILGSIRFYFRSEDVINPDKSKSFFLTRTSLNDNTKVTTTSTIPENFNSQNYTNMYIYGANEADENGLQEADITNIMISKNVLTEYIPYGKYRIPVKINGKNLFDINSLITNNNPGVKNLTINGNNFSFAKAITNYSSAVSSYIYLNKGTYTISGQWSGTGLKAGFAILDPDNNFIVNHAGEGVNTTFNINDSGKYRLAFYDAYTNPVNTITTFSNIQLERGSKATAYEPYVEPVTTNIYLDEPLRSIGNYKDYIDFETKTVVRKIKEIELTSKSPFNKYNVLNPLNNSGIMEMDDSGEISPRVNSSLISTHFKYNNNIENEDTESIGILNNKIGVRINYNTINTTSSMGKTEQVNKFLEYLDSFNKKIKVLYVLEGKDEVITSEPSIPDITTIEGQTIITIGEGAIMEGNL